MHDDDFVTDYGHWSYAGVQLLKMGTTSPCMPTTVGTEINKNSGARFFSGHWEDSLGRIDAARHPVGVLN